MTEVRSLILLEFFKKYVCNRCTYSGQSEREVMTSYPVCSLYVLFHHDIRASGHEVAVHVEARSAFCLGVLP